MTPFAKYRLANRWAAVSALAIVATTTLGQPVDQVVSLYSLAAGDYVEFQMRQDSGGALDTYFESPWAPTFMMAKVLG